ncbi:MAG: CPBP family intramembrane metalloprotease [Clostridiales bacterium]|nr:CPBP family intramembrane metalloprotease [Clostridiales bacterium]
MKTKLDKKPIETCVFIFLLCSAVRMIEYFAIRTDETVLAENFLHKIFGIVILAITLRRVKISWDSIGFKKVNIVQNILKGFAFATVCFSVAYFIECISLYCMNGSVKLSVYISGFSLNGEMIKQNGIIFVILCIGFNVINVWMEEGIFRGLFSKLLISKMKFGVTIFFIALLFGIWHWVMPLRDFIEGRSSVANLLVMGIGYTVLAGIMSIKWSILYKVSGSLWIGLGDHLFNNVIVTNLLHVISNNDADSMKIVRIMIGQLISFLLVMIYYRKTIDNNE